MNSKVAKNLADNKKCIFFVIFSNQYRLCKNKTKGSSVNVVTQFWTILDTPAPFIVTRLITKSIVLSSQNP